MATAPQTTLGQLGDKASEYIKEGAGIAGVLGKNTLEILTTQRTASFVISNCMAYPWIGTAVAVSALALTVGAIGVRYAMPDSKVSKEYLKPIGNYLWDHSGSLTAGVALGAFRALGLQAAEATATCAAEAVKCTAAATNITVAKCAVKAAKSTAVTCAAEVAKTAAATCAAKAVTCATAATKTLGWSRWVVDTLGAAALASVSKFRQRWIKQGHDGRSEVQELNIQIQDLERAIEAFKSRAENAEARISRGELSGQYAELAAQYQALLTRCNMMGAEKESLKQSLANVEKQFYMLIQMCQAQLLPNHPICRELQRGVVAS